MNFDEFAQERTTTFPALVRTIELAREWGGGIALDSAEHSYFNTAERLLQLWRNARAPSLRTQTEWAWIRENRSRLRKCFGPDFTLPEESVAVDSGLNLSPTTTPVNPRSFFEGVPYAEGLRRYQSWLHAAGQPAPR